MNQSSISERDVFRTLLQREASRANYIAHPSDEVLEAYLKGTLPQDLRHTPEVLAQMAQGTLTDWHHAEVGLHFKTCARCWKKMIGLRTQQRAPLEQKATVLGTIRDKLRYLLFPGSPRRIVIPIVFALALGLIAGVYLSFWLQGVENNDVQLGEFIDDENVMPTPSSALNTGNKNSKEDAEKTEESARGIQLLKMLQTAGIDLTGFEIEKSFITYIPQQGETLKHISLTQYGNEQFWIVIYLFNYEYLKHLENPSETVLTNEPQLQLPMQKSRID